MSIRANDECTSIEWVHLVPLMYFYFGGSHQLLSSPCGYQKFRTPMCKESYNLTAIFLKDLCLNPPYSSLVWFFPLISLEETGNKSSLSSPLWQLYFTKFHQLLFSQTVIFSRQKSSDPFNHCSYSTPLASMLKNWSTNKHECSERTAFDCRHCYKLIYPGWLMTFSFKVRHVCFFCPCAKEAQWTLASPSTHSQPQVLRQRVHASKKKSRSRVSRNGSLLLQSEFSWSNYSEPYFLCSLGPQQNFH